MPRYAKLIYNGYWWAPERLMLQKAIDESQTVVNGEVRVRLYKGNVTVTGRRSSDTLFDDAIATFETMLESMIKRMRRALSSLMHFA